MSVSEPLTGTFNSHEGWAACAACAALVRKGDREALARRSVKRYRKLYPHAIPLTLREVRRLHDTFWSNREGEGKPWDGTPG
jgi:hypothetical protein